MIVRIRPRPGTPAPAHRPVKIRVVLSKPERSVIRTRRPIKVSEWAERHRMVGASVFPGPWKNSVTPYGVGIMDAADFPSVETVILCKSPQVGGTEFAHNCVGKWCDRSPGQVMYLFPDKDLAARNASERIVPMFESSPRLRTFMTGYEDDKTQKLIRLKTLTIYLAWSGSPSTVSNTPVRYAVSDEEDKYAFTAGKKETDAIKLLEKRMNTYRSVGKAKHIRLSTPTVESGPIWKALTEEAQVIFDYHVRCPECTLLQVMTDRQIKFPENERDPETVYSKKLAWYECEHCAAKWNDDDRNRAVGAGQWIARENGMGLWAYLKSFRPAKIGFHLPAWISPFVALSECASAFLKSLKDKNALKDYKNNYAAEPWVTYSATKKEDAVLALCDDRPRGKVPGGGIVAGMTAGVDTHQAGFWYEIRAWGYGYAPESWCIREGFVETFAALETVLWGSDYPDPDGNRYHVLMAFQDAMGGVRRESAGYGTRVAEVYDFCKKHRGKIMPIQGGKPTMLRPIMPTDLEYYPGGKRLIPGGLRLIRLNVNYFKNMISGKMDIAPGDPGAWHFHSELPADYALHYTSEGINEQGIWECPNGRDNHLWDCSVYGAAAAEYAGLQYVPRPDAAPAPAKQPPARGNAVNKRRRPGWLGRR